MADIVTLFVADGPAAFGVDSYQWVSLAMLVLIGVVVWKKVPGMITGGLDAKIEEIKQQLDEAKALRAEAEVLRDEYAAKKLFDCSAAPGALSPLTTAEALLSLPKQSAHKGQRLQQALSDLSLCSMQNTVRMIQSTTINHSFRRRDRARAKIL